MAHHINTVLNALEVCFDVHYAICEIVDIYVSNLEYLYFYVCRWNEDRQKNNSFPNFGDCDI